MKNRKKYTGSALVACTNDSSTASKASMASLGYFQDGFIEKFVSRVERRSPLINRGYFIRVWAIDRFVREFLNAYDKETTQIVSCGAGFDSLYFRLNSDLLSKTCLFVEIDLPTVVEKKLKMKNLMECNALSSNQNSNSTNYILLPCDLRNSERLFSLLLNDCHLDASKPTLFLAECVFNYLNPTEADNIIRNAFNIFIRSSFIIYEQVLPDDSFGCFMRRHFGNIGSPLTCISQYPTVEEQRKRFENMTWPYVCCTDMLHLWRKIFNRNLHRLVQNIEPFDEYEMWHLKCSHYVMSTCSKDEHFIKRLTSLQSPQNTVVAKENGVIKINKTNTVDIDAKIQRCGHRCVYMKSLNLIVCCGGWGPDSSGRHRRLPSLVALNLDYQLLLLEEKAVFERCYHSCTAISDRAILIFGGRKSPQRPLDDCHVVYFDNDFTRQLSAIVKELHLSDKLPSRWRHSACHLLNEVVFVCGGITWPFQVINDCWTFCLENNSENVTNKRLPDMPVSLHSHFCCCNQSNAFLAVSSYFIFKMRRRLLATIFVMGGLMNADEEFFNGLLLFDINSNVWTTYCENILPQGLYGCSGHWFTENDILLVGGIWEDGKENRGVCVINLKEKVSRQQIDFDRKQNGDLLMLTNHDSVFLSDAKKLVIFGGGGNCFSFGTLLNPGVTVVEL